MLKLYMNKYVTRFTCCRYLIYTIHKKRIASKQLYERTQQQKFLMYWDNSSGLTMKLWNITTNTLTSPFFRFKNNIGHKMLKVDLQVNCSKFLGLLGRLPVDKRRGLMGLVEMGPKYPQISKKKYCQQYP